MKVLFSGRFDPDIINQLKEHWSAEWRALQHRPVQFALPEEELIESLQPFDVLVTEGDSITAKVLSACPRLKAVVTARGNPVNVDVEAATEHGIVVANTPGRNKQAVAELCIALMVMIARNVVPALEALQSGQWAEAPRAWAYLTFQGIELAGRTVGLVGLGAIGREVAKRLRAFDMRILAYDPYVSQDVADTVGVELVPIEVLLRESDFVSMHVHVTDDTRGMIGREQFALMKPTAFFINTGRAGVVDEQAMLEALRERRIAGGAFDVYHREPLSPDDPLMDMPNVVLLPHIGGATIDVVRHHTRLAKENLDALRAGRVPPYLVNPQVLQRANLRLKIDALKTRKET